MCLALQEGEGDVKVHKGEWGHHPRKNQLTPEKIS